MPFGKDPDQHTSGHSSPSVPLVSTWVFKRMWEQKQLPIQLLNYVVLTMLTQTFSARSNLGCCRTWSRALPQFLLPLPGLVILTVIPIPSPLGERQWMSCRYPARVLASLFNHRINIYQLVFSLPLVQGEKLVHETFYFIRGVLLSVFLTLFVEVTLCLQYRKQEQKVNLF